MNDNMLNVNNLKLWYKTYRGYSKVLDGVSLHIKPGTKVGLVGESGCGKTTTMKAVMRLLDQEAVIKEGSEISFNGEDILSMKDKDLYNLRRNKISMISQSPMAALNPVIKIGDQMMDVIRYTGRVDKDTTNDEIKMMAVDAIREVMIPDPERILNEYPHELSGGMRQRICIATALAKPCQLLIADEPGTALDVTIQEQIYNLLRELVSDGHKAFIMITHSLGVIRELVDQLYIMYAGNIVEYAENTKDIFINPLHPYTKGLLDCVPRLFGGGLSEGIYGYVPDYNNPPTGCRFYNRCHYCKHICQEAKPPMIEVEPGHYVSCFKYSENF